MRWSWLYLVLAVVVGACSDTGESSTVAPAGSDAAASVLGSPAIVDTTPAGGFGEASSCQVV